MSAYIIVHTLKSLRDKMIWCICLYIYIPNAPHTRCIQHPFPSARRTAFTALLHQRAAGSEFSASSFSDCALFCLRSGMIFFYVDRILCWQLLFCISFRTLMFYCFWWEISAHSNCSPLCNMFCLQQEPWFSFHAWFSALWLWEAWVRFSFHLSYSQFSYCLEPYNLCQSPNLGDG